MKKQQSMLAGAAHKAFKKNERFDEPFDGEVTLLREITLPTLLC